MASGSGVQRVDITMFDDAYAKFNTAITVFHDAKKKMSTQSERLLNSWEGKGKDAFSKAYRQLETAITDETENLEAIRDDLQAIKDSYSDWDAESGKVMSENSVK